MTEARRPKPTPIPIVRVRQGTGESAKDLIWYILAVSGGRLEAKTRLYKAFYASHLFCHRLSQGFLTNHPIVHMPHGPGIDDGDELIEALIEDGVLDVSIERPDELFPEQVFRLHRAYGHSLEPDDLRLEAVAAALRWVNSKTPAELTAETHEKSRSWNETENGEEMDIYRDLLTDQEIARREKALHEAETMVSAVFAQ
jgi:hypothetical protein